MVEKVKEFDLVEIESQLQDSYNYVHDLFLSKHIEAFLTLFKENKPVMWFEVYKQIIPTIERNVTLKMDDLMDSYLRNAESFLIKTIMNYSQIEGFKIQSEKISKYVDGLYDFITEFYEEGKEVTIENKYLLKSLSYNLKQKRPYVNLKKSLFNFFDKGNSKILSELIDTIVKLAFESYLNKKLKFIRSDKTIDIEKIKYVMILLNIIKTNKNYYEDILFNFFKYGLHSNSSNKTKLVRI